MDTEPQFFFDLSTMARFSLKFNRVGLYFRFACFVAMILVLSKFAVGDRWRVVQLSLIAAGLALAWLDGHPELEQWAAKNGVVAPLVRYFYRHRTVSAATPSGLCEGLGVVSAALLFGGPYAASISVSRSYALLVVILYAWSAFAEVVVHPGYYRESNTMSLLLARWLLPAAAAIAAFLLFYWPFGAHPASLVIAAALAAALLLLWVYAWTVNLLGRCARVTADEWASAVAAYQRDDHTEIVHRAKAQLRAQQLVAVDESAQSALSYALLVIEDARRHILLGIPDDGFVPHPVQETWSQYLSTLPGEFTRRRLRLQDNTSGDAWISSAVQVLQYVLVDLVGNALRASSNGLIQVDIRTSNRAGSHCATVQVIDDGVGGAPDNFTAESSMGALDRICRFHGGKLEIDSNDSGGTVAIASFRYLALGSNFASHSSQGVL
jgi:signal transduction histidine kinase